MAYGGWSALPLLRVPVLDFAHLSYSTRFLFHFSLGPQGLEFNPSVEDENFNSDGYGTLRDACRPV